MNQKEQFIENEILANVVNGAFLLRRGGKIYGTSATADDRKWFGCKVKKYLSNIREHYTNGEKVNHERHIKEISQLKDRLSEYRDRNGRDILQSTQITFGVAQKLLNLYLKYFWCMKVIEEPPHCPIDSIVLKEIGMSNLRWPRMDKSEYVQAIKEIQKAAKKEGLTIAKWELNLFNRKNPAYQCVKELDRKNTKKDLHHD